MTYNELKTKWESIPVNENAYILLDGSHPIEFNVGYEILNRKTLVIVDSGEVQKLISSRSIEMKNYQLSDGRWLLSFSLVTNNSEDVFMWLCWDIIESSRFVVENKVKFVLDRYLKWLHLFEQKSSELLSVSMQKGLIGELLFIEELAEKQGPDKAISSWSGPEGTDQDFIYDETWDEIKTSILAAESIKISSIQQLDMEKPGSLIVYFIEKTTDENKHGFTLFDKVKHVRGICELFPLAKDLFEVKLLKYGYRDNTEYKTQKYRFCEARKYNVNDEFPRLTRKSVCSSITQAQYQLALTALEKFLYEEQ